MGLTAAIAFSAVGTATSAVGQIKAGNAAYRTAQVNASAAEDTAELNAQLIEEGAATNAGILDFNARMLEAQARDAIRRGFTDEERFALSGRQFVGTQRASYARQGLDLESGSPLDVIADTKYQISQDVLAIRVNAAREAWGFQVDAADVRHQREALLKNAELEAKATRKKGRIDAMNERLGGSYARSASRTGAAATILGGAGTLLSQAYGYKQATRKGK